MDTKTNMAKVDAIEVLNYWKNIPIGDVYPLQLNQKIDQTISDFLSILNDIEDLPKEASSQFLSYVWSISVRDFTILLRDTILASTKQDQFVRDDREVDDRYANKLQEVLQNSSRELSDEYLSSREAAVELNEWQHQQSPIREVKVQLIELQKQSKKIYRSSYKIDDVRANTSEYIKDFQLQYSKQTLAVDHLFEIVQGVKEVVKTISLESSESKITEVVDEIGDKIQELELIQGTDPMDIIPYTNKETISIPVSTLLGNLTYKTINVKSEFGRWFSSLVYPKLVELESKRDHALEKCLLAFSQVRTKIAAISISEMDEKVHLQKEFGAIFSQLDSEILLALKNESKETDAFVSDQLNNRLKASNIYSKDLLFLPESGSNQISNLSKDAQKRIVNIYERYTTEFKTYVNKLLSKYIEVDKTPYSLFVKNKLSIYDKDDSLALFLKNGYLGKSFTVPRPVLMDPILRDYNLWLEGFAGAILLSGMTGSGKSTILGMLNHIGLNEEIIQLKTGESYFIRHKSYEPIFNLKSLIELVVKRTGGRRVIICIDDLELWHDHENDLFDNITNLFDIIVKYRTRVFFIVTCSPFLKNRIKVFRKLDSVFSSEKEMGKMSSNQIRTAISLRARVNKSMDINENEGDASYNNIVRESKGNPGYAMMEYCRNFNESYKSNVKSQEFKELIKSNATLLNYISAYQHCSINALSGLLSELDLRGTKESIFHLIGQKILVKPKKGIIAINPLLIHTIEQTLLKIKN